MDTFIKSLAIGFALAVEYFESLVLDQIEKRKQERGVLAVKTYYFMIKATRYSVNSVTSITKPIAITVDSTRYTKHQAMGFAVEEFNWCNSQWSVQATVMTVENYQLMKKKLDDQIALLEGKYDYTKTFNQ